jgi:alcohol dehydrogenase (cytochrome c)
MHLLAIALGAWFAAQAAPEAPAFPGLPALAGETARQAAGLFQAHCAPCHGPRGEGGRGPTLLRPKLPRAYWGTGNPGPDWNGDARKGDNLYCNSIVALDADSGKLRWHFQFTPHDDHDWDSTHVPVLFDGNVGGRPLKLVALANRNAFYYVLDRLTGEFLAAKPYVKQTWAKGLDARGRPIVLPNTSPSVEGTRVYPSLNGGTVWFSPSFHPEKNLFYVAAREVGSIYYKAEAKYKAGTLFFGGGERGIPGDDAYGAVRALEAETGKCVWEFRLQTPPWAGVLSTAGGLVFGGTNEGAFFAVDAATGQPLWHFQTGEKIAANPVSYESEGKQHVAIAAGHAIFSFALDYVADPSGRK